MLIAIKGEKNSGKTSFIEKMLEKLKDFKIIVIKSSGHEKIDEEGKDTYRYRKAGAEASIIVAKEETAIFINNVSIEEAIKLARKFSPDLIIVEGYKSIENLNCKIIDMEKNPNVDEICNEILKEMKRKRIEIFVDGKILPLNKFVEEIFYKTIEAMLSCLKNGKGKEIEIRMIC